MRTLLAVGAENSKLEGDKELKIGLAHGNFDPYSECFAYPLSRQASLTPALPIPTMML
jgi:hypothetical protein